MKRVLSAILVAVLLVACLPVTAAHAEAIPTKVEKLQVSEKLISMIKDEEGFSATPYWDYSQYSIGYGCAVKDKNGQLARTKEAADAVYPNGITKAEADELLRKEVAENYAAPVNNFAINRSFVFTQNQFDALVSFTYNVGSAWMQKKFRVVRWLEDNLTKSKLTADEELDFMSSIGAWCRAGQDLLPALCRRRTTEAKMFLYGAYPNEKSPREFSYVIYHAEKSTMANGYEDMAEYYIRGTKMGELPTPKEAAGYTFEDWSLSDGVKLTASTTITQQSLVAYAKWKTDGSATVPPVTEPTETDPTKPTEDTEPKPTETDPTEPTKPTEPEPTEPVELPYEDVAEDKWYADAVRFVYEEGLFAGTTETTFSPNDEMTRAMLVAVLWRHAGHPEASEEAGFQDVPKTTEKSYYAIPVAWAKEYGIVAGISETEFGPKRQVTREQLAAILYRYCVKYWGIKAENGKDLTDFTDADEVSNFAREPMKWAVGNGIISGMGDGTLDPKGSATRAQVASMLMRTVQNILY